MNRYPFDVQKCDGTLEPMKNSDFFVKLVPKYLNYHGPTDLMKYQLETNISFIQTDNVKIKYILNSKVILEGFHKTPGLTQPSRMTLLNST